ncbi:MAG: metallophosphoesterase [Dethiobacter sp.]|jgi:putative phosphoesterase|nr:metallophosphoesterase [Dethiobacter sp.]MBS3902513.1 metallophosphoesterase [Dethiobacter sp.]MBS3989993.1 metallophosphoesterase [Dethiobacter sp.]
MRIGVISDTHIPARARLLPSELFTLFDGVDLVLHAGDLVEESVLQELAAIAPVEAVAGNMDSWELHNRLGRKKILELAGYRIGLIHGDSGNDRSKTPQRVLQSFKQDSVDCIIFGHSHQPYHQTIQGILLFNPGSPTDRRRESRHSCGLLTVGETITAQLLLL